MTGPGSDGAAGIHGTAHAPRRGDRPPLRPWSRRAHQKRLDGHTGTLSSLLRLPLPRQPASSASVERGPPPPRTNFGSNRQTNRHFQFLSMRAKKKLKVPLILSSLAFPQVRRHADWRGFGGGLTGTEATQSPKQSKGAERESPLPVRRRSRGSNRRNESRLPTSGKAALVTECSQTEGRVSADEARRIPSRQTT